MATETTNYHFSKPAETDYYDVNVQNNNWDVADQALKELDDEKVDKNGGDIANTEVSEFAASSTEWPVPAAGEAPKTLWGKTKKFFEDFKNWMTGVCLLGQLVSNNTTNNANLPASAAAVYQEAQLRANQIAQLNSDLGSSQYVGLSGRSDDISVWETVGSMNLSPGTYIIYAQAVLRNADIKLLPTTPGCSARNYSDVDTSVSLLTFRTLSEQTQITVQIKRQTTSGPAATLDGNSEYHILRAIRLK